MTGRSSMHQHRFNLAQESQWPGAAGEAWQPGALPQVTSAVTLFADIVGYTEHCETLGPEEAYLLLCDFYQRTNHATTMHNAAIVDHFGDTLLAVWKANVPLAAQAFRALRCAFTILREAANNAVKTGRAANVALEVTDDAKAVVGLIEDDGAGFDVAAVLGSYAGRGSLGLLQMREAARLIGAQLSIDSSPGNGTRVRLKIPKS